MDLDNMNLISVTAAADIIGCTVGRVRQLLIAYQENGKGELRGEKINEKAWVVDRRSAERYAKRPQKRGRPRRKAS